MDLLKSWVVAVLTWVAGSVISTVLAVNTATLAELQTFSGRVLAFYLPSLVVTALAAAFAALVHPAPQRAKPGRHALAALAVPGVIVVAGLINSAVQASGGEVLVATLVAGVVGAVAGWQLADALRRPRSGSATRYGYPY